MSQQSIEPDDNVKKIMDYALSLGVNDIRLLDAEQISVEDHFRKNCEEPRCPNFDTSLNCPPHAPTPKKLRDKISGYRKILALKFDMPMEALQGTKRIEAGRLLQDTTVDIEHFALSLGFKKAIGYSSGGCKKTYCGEYKDCSAITEKGKCRFPDKARPSIGGMGVNVFELSKTLGWQMLKDEQGEDNPLADTVMMVGIVLLD